MAHSAASPFVYIGIPALAAGVAVLFLAGIAASERRLGRSGRSVFGRVALGVLGALGWAGLSLGLAASGVLARFDARPPPLLVLLMATLVGAVALGRSRFGARLARGLPLWALIGFQAFRLPLELVLHRAALDGTMPVEMSFSGYNFDIVSGASAALVAVVLLFVPARGRFARRAALSWNGLGLLLLGNIVVIAIAATPVFHAFGQAHLNVWISEPPFVLLPSILVLAALFGHVLVLRKLQQLGGEGSLTVAGASSADVPSRGSADPHRLDKAHSAAE